MSVSQIKSIEHFKKDETIKSGVYFCPKCEAIFSAYYLRTFSINCLRGVNFGRCSSCNLKNKQTPKRLSRDGNCLECYGKVDNYFQKICSEKLQKMSFEKFKKFCFEAINVYPVKSRITIPMLEGLFLKLSESDFTSASPRRQSGLLKADISTAIKNLCFEEKSRSKKKVSNY